jgi:autotransporter strand-loop-strand O-heptosyltransferase
MKICQVVSGFLPVPTTEEQFANSKWGAVELIMWEYKHRLEAMGHTVDVKYLNEVQPNEYDIVHIHVANLAIECAKKGIPYVFSHHDHHAYHFGKDSFNYIQNREAIQKSIVSFCHAEFLVDYFECDKLFFLSHGVNTSYFKSSDKKEPFIKPKLLCLANNGLAGDVTIDRKGFRYAVEAARELGYGITIVGTDTNRKYFDANPDIASYEGLNLIADNPSRDATLEIYQTHDIFLHPSSLEAGSPNLTLLESISCGIPVVGTYQGKQKISGLYNLPELNTREVVAGIKTVTANYNDYVQQTRDPQFAKSFDWNVIVGRLERIYQSVSRVNEQYDSNKTRDLYIKNLEETPKNEIMPQSDIQVNFHSVQGMFLEIKSKINSDKEYDVKFTDKEGNLVYATKLKANMWSRLNNKYFMDLKATVSDGDEVIYEKQFSDLLKGRRVFINFESKSLGDSIAWMPYCLEFKKKHDCQVIVSTFQNHLFEKVYPELEFVPRGATVHNLVAMYDIGWFYDSTKEPVYPSTVPLQKAASNILGLEFEEICPRIDFTPSENSPYKGKYITIATESTAGLKYWYYWQELIDYLIEQGYTVVHVSKEKCKYKNVVELKDKGIFSTMNAIHHSNLFIGLSSGISWLSYAIRKHVVMIANFTEKDHEFTNKCTRIYDESICNSCWNNEMFKFDKGDFMWCPLHKDTDRHFECHKLISAKTVIEKIKDLI